MMRMARNLEPMELAYVDVPDEFTGAVISKLQQRKGELQNMGSSRRRLYTIRVLRFHPVVSSVIVVSS